MQCAPKQVCGEAGLTTTKHYFHLTVLVPMPPATLDRRLTSACRCSYVSPIQ